MCEKKMKALSAAAAFALIFTACGTTDDTSETLSETTTEETSVNTEQLSDEDKEAVNAAADELLPEAELANKTIKWLAHYDLNPDGRGGSKSVALEMFESKYGGQIEHVVTTWENRWNDLSTHVLGGDGIDFFPFETRAVPKGIVSGMFVPIDDYVDFESPLWQETAPYMDEFLFNGKHYEMCTGVTPEAVVIYSRKTINENGFDDPWELYQNGEWNWDTFKTMLTDFIDADPDNEGLDGYYYQKALGLSAGASAVRLNNGFIELTLDSPRLDREMQLAEDMYAHGLFLDKSLYDWQEQPQLMGEGRELFYFCGSWILESDHWNLGIDPADAAMVPVPCCPDYEETYSIIPDGFMLCKGTKNPEGVALYAQCCIAASLDENSRKISDEKKQRDYKWTDELLEQYHECNNAAKEHPFYDMGYGISDDFVAAINDTVMYKPFEGSSYAQGKDECRDVAKLLVDELNNSLKNIG